MIFPTSNAVYLCGLAIVCRVLAAPAPLATFNSDPNAIPTGTVPGPPGASGSLRGPESLLGYSSSNPISDDSSVIPTSDFQLAPGQSEDAELGLYLDFSGVENPQPIRGSTDAPTDPGPRTSQYEILNSDLYAPPGTDKGSVPNAKWPLGLSHNRHGNPATAGWARQQNVDVLPSATAMAGVDMRLSPYAYRELHWHRANEWALVLNGSVRVGAVNEEGQTTLDDLQAGDLWFFPAGIPHTIQALETGCEFLLIFDDGSFDESGTFLVSELFARNPKSVLAKDLRTDVGDFADIPEDQLYIFPGTPPPSSVEEQSVVGPAGTIPKNSSYTYHFSQQEPYTVPGGSIKVVDSVNFPIAYNFAAALVHVDPGAMRELHWHVSDEWQYYLQGQARMTVFTAPESSQTFDFSAGDVGYISNPSAHYIENTGNETLVFLEMLLAPRFSDISVGQWLGLTPPQIVKDTLKLPDRLINKLPKVKPYILPGNKNLLTTNFTDEAL